MSGFVHIYMHVLITGSNSQNIHLLVKSVQFECRKVSQQQLSLDMAGCQEGLSLSLLPMDCSSCEDALEIIVEADVAGGVWVVGENFS